MGGLIGITDNSKSCIQDPSDGKIFGLIELVVIADTVDYSFD